MPTLSTIQSVLQPLFEVDLPPSVTFALRNNEVVSLTKDRLETVDRDYYFVKMDDLLGIPVIKRKLKK